MYMFHMSMSIFLCLPHRVFSRLLAWQVRQILCFQTVRVHAFSIEPVFQGHKQCSTLLCHFNMVPWEISHHITLLGICCYAISFLQYWVQVCWGELVYYTLWKWHRVIPVKTSTSEIGLSPPIKRKTGPWGSSQCCSFTKNLWARRENSNTLSTVHDVGKSHSP